MAIVENKGKIATKLRSRADHEGVSTYDIASGTSLHQSTVNDIIQGNVDDPGIKKVLEITNFLGMDLDEIT